MTISASDIQKIREETGAGVMDCKKALEEAGGDMTKALILIKERGFAKAEKRVGRDTGAGIIMSYVHNGRIGALVDVRAETDFVVRSEPFQALAHELAMQVAAIPAENVEEFLKQPYIKDEKKTVEDLVKDVIARVGENVRVNAFSRLEL
jgi:elongation factor Ts